LRAGRRLLSDDLALLEGTALAAARRVDALRVARERWGREVREREIRQLATEAELRALVANEVQRGRRMFAAAAPAVAAAPASVRPGVRLACAVYESVLDRVEAAGYDVLGRRTGVRFWRMPLVAREALRR